MAERRIYSNPPIREALCEVRFAKPEPWDVRTPGALADGAEDLYDSDPELAFQSALNVDDLDGSPEIRIQDPVPSVRFTGGGGTRRLIINPASFSVHVLRPYKSWEEFRPLIQGGMELYQSSLRPKGVSRIGIRYINEIMVPEGSDLTEYVRSVPSLPDDNPAELIAGFISRIEGVSPERNVRVIHTIARAPAPDGYLGVVLDIDVIREWEIEPLEISRATAEVDALRTIERQAFETMITDRSRGLFDG